MTLYNKQGVSPFPYIDAWCWGFVTNLKSASKDTDHEHDYRQIVSKHIPPWLQNSERWLLFRELSKFHHRNHAACYKTMENDVTWPSVTSRHWRVKKKGKDKAVCMDVVGIGTLKTQCFQKVQVLIQQALDKNAWIYGWTTVMGERWDHCKFHIWTSVWRLL